MARGDEKMTKQCLSLCALGVGSAVLMSQMAVAQVTTPKPAAKDKPAAKANDKGTQKAADTPRVTRKPAVPDDAKETRDAAKAHAKDARDSAEDRAKDARDSAKDRTLDARDSTKDRRDDSNNKRDTARDRRQDTRDDNKDQRKDGTDKPDTARDRAKHARDTAKDKKDRAKDARDDAKDVTTNRKDRNQEARKFDAEKVKPDDLGLSFKDSDDGIAISNVEKNSAFIDAGFQSGDQIVSINGRNIARQSDFMSYLFAPNVVSAGRVPVVVMRNGARETLYVQPRTIIRNYETVVFQGRNPVRDFGLVLDRRNDDRVFVQRVIEGSPADQAGIKVDDMILAVNKQPVETPDDLAQLLEKHEGERIDMEVDRDRQAKVIEAKVLR
jgi:C-terminal processing protease CtpA/Prc